MVTIGVLLAPAPTRAGDGAKLLKQPGAFPIVISQSGSYRLKSNLVVPDANTTAIDVEASDVTIDLNGFAILGPYVCSGTPGNCRAGGSGGGITGPGAVTPARVTVRNGTVKGMGGTGISLGEQGIVEDVRAIGNSGNGILVLGEGKIVGSIAIGNSGYGITTGGGRIVTGNIANGNSAGINSGDDVVSGNTANRNYFSGIACSFGTVTGNTANQEQPRRNRGDVGHGDR
jgi:hypothetical protein